MPAVIAAIINGAERNFTDAPHSWRWRYSAGGRGADAGRFSKNHCYSTVTARMQRIISNHTIQPGDVIVGFASFGRATSSQV